MITREIVRQTLSTDIEVIVEDDGQVTLTQSGQVILVDHPVDLGNTLISAFYPSQRAKRESAKGSHLWPCGCLINEAGAHRGDCPQGRNP